MSKNATVLESAAGVLNTLAGQIDQILDLRRQAERFEMASWEYGGDTPDDLHHRQNLARQAASLRHQADQEAMQADSLAAGKLYELLSLVSIGFERAHRDQKQKDLYQEMEREQQKPLDHGAVKEDPYPELIYDALTGVFGLAKGLAKYAGKKAVEGTVETASIEASKEASEAVSETIQTGGRELSVDDYLKRLDQAEELYESFRKSNVDVQAIAKNTGMTEERVQRIKDHLFFKEHIKDHGVGSFEADYEIAQAWERLQNGTHKQNDLDLLNHELFESRFEGIFNTDYRTAHDKTVKSGRPWYPPEEE
ncbi:hypothetical protein [Tumebacillus flagellatus]|uniref:Uncharacterized protein n=1 Tax=Tumebacillus flagellatus TaxID=1157490 RepID=A0A074LXH3_9BACL|nr:hypothetical protein [Tumebacillus flagellatus]KEO84823.1 hypothetical protein EL26_02090 [Tumebacillus flagellatus]